MSIETFGGSVVGARVRPCGVLFGGQLSFLRRVSRWRTDHLRTSSAQEAARSRDASVAGTYRERFTE